MKAKKYTFYIELKKSAEKQKMYNEFGRKCKAFSTR